MTYRIVSTEPLSASGTATSSAIKKLDDTLEFARDLIADGVEVLRIEDGACAMVHDADEVKAWRGTAEESGAVVTWVRDCGRRRRPGHLDFGRGSVASEDTSGLVCGSSSFPNLFMSRGHARGRDRVKESA